MLRHAMPILLLLAPLAAATPPATQLDEAKEGLPSLKRLDDFASLHRWHKRKLHQEGALSTTTYQPRDFKVALAAFHAAADLYDQVYSLEEAIEAF